MRLYARQRGTRFLHRLLDDTRIEFDAGDELARLRFVALRETGEQRRRFAHETLFVMLHGLLCWLIGRRIAIRTARFAYPQPLWWREYIAVYAGDVGFDATQTVFTFNALDLDEIGRAAGRERGWKYGEISVVAD